MDARFLDSVIARTMGPDVPGHGLGLAGVKALMAAMKGKITLVSHEGSGTRFTLQIPRLP
jgi:signal transduction histidine kinase